MPYLDYIDKYIYFYETIDVQIIIYFSLKHLSNDAVCRHDDAQYGICNHPQRAVRRPQRQLVVERVECKTNRDQTQQELERKLAQERRRLEPEECKIKPERMAQAGRLAQEQLVRGLEHKRARVH